MADAYFNRALNRLKSSIDSRLENETNEKYIVKLLEQTRKDIQGENITEKQNKLHYFSEYFSIFYAVKNITTC